jgi:DNA-binding Xre family transcriptional regulator
MVDSGGPHDGPHQEERMSGRPDPQHFGRIQLRVDEMARHRGFVHRDGKAKGKVNSSQLARATMTVDSSIWPLLRAPDTRAGISFEMIARLCAALHCTPGDLFEYLPPGAASTAPPPTPE